jgi:hypothetical protein
LFIDVITELPQLIYNNDKFLSLPKLPILEEKSRLFPLELEDIGINLICVSFLMANLLLEQTNGRE